MAKILFIEDEAALQKTLGGRLKEKGLEVIAALDGETALNIIKSTKIDLILLDLILPRKSGFEILRELKENAETKDIPVIILTNLENMKDIEQAMEMGATTYLVKTNYSLDEVVEKIKATLEK